MLPILKLIVDTVAAVLGGVLLLRFWMQVIRVRPPAPVAHFTFTLSDWLVKPLRRLVPGMGGFDWASLIGAFLVVLAASSVNLLGGVSGYYVLWIAFFTLADWIIYGLMGLLFIEVIFSWINPHAPLAPFVRALNAPLLRPIQRVVPPVGGIDFSVLVAFVLLQIVRYLVHAIPVV